MRGKKGKAIFSLLLILFLLISTSAVAAPAANNLPQKERPLYLAQLRKIVAEKLPHDNFLFKAQGAAVISGKVTDQNNNPLAGIDVYVLAEPLLLQKSVTDANGNYSITVPAGSYLVIFDPTQYNEAHDKNYVGQIYNGKSPLDLVAGEPDFVMVGDGETKTGIDARLVMGGSISGRVKTASDSPVGGVSVYALPESYEEMPLGEAVSDSSGNYKIRGLLPGIKYKLFFDANAVQGQKLVSQFYRGKQVISNADSVTVNSNQNTALADVVLNKPSTPRLAGNTRIDTAVEISKNTFKKADTVVIATAYNFPDALAGVPLAYAYKAPLLLTDPAALSPQVKNEIQRLGATKVVILGGTGAVSAQVESALKNLNLTVTRIAGKNRYETAVKVAEKLEEVNTTFERVIVATGTNYADALAVSSYAALTGSPILLTDSVVLSPETESFLKGRSLKPDVVIVGGPVAVANAVQSKLAAIVGAGKVERVAGSDRIDTAIKVRSRADAEMVFEGIAAPKVAILTTGFNFADALAGGVMAAMMRAPIFLTHPAQLDWRNEDAITSSCSDVIILGGTQAVSASVEKRVDEILNLY